MYLSYYNTDCLYYFLHILIMYRGGKGVVAEDVVVAVLINA